MLKLTKATVATDATILATDAVYVDKTPADQSIITTGMNGITALMGVEPVTAKEHFWGSALLAGAGWFGAKFADKGAMDRGDKIGWFVNGGVPPLPR